MFYLPVTTEWLEQYALYQHQTGQGFRNILGGLNILLDVNRSIGWAHNLIKSASKKATTFHQDEDLSPIKTSANDELYIHNRPLLTSICTNSLYCPLLKKSPDRSAETWALHIMDLMDKGYKPQSVILDGLASLHAGHKLAIKDINIIYDTFHIIKDLNDLKRMLKNRQKSTATNVLTLEAKLDRAKLQVKVRQYRRQLKVAQQQAEEAATLYESVSTLIGWIQHDILIVAGYNYKTRLSLMGFITEELEKLEHGCAHRIKPLRVTLQKNVSKLLGFVSNLEADLVQYANELECDVYWLWEICYAQRYPISSLKYHQRLQKVRARLKHRFYDIQEGVVAIMDNIEKASSVVENLNGRIRRFIQGHVTASQETLDLLRFILNNSRFNRSRREHRVGKSPAEILYNQAQPHWLSLLGYTLFKRAA